MRLTLEQFEVVQEAPSEIGDPYFNNWIIIEEGDWIDDCKCDIKICIVYKVDTNEYFRYTLTRSGSYHSDYHYDHRDNGYVDLELVKPVTKTITVTEWV